MTAKEYRDTPEYDLLRRKIVEQLVNATNACIVAPDMAQKEYNHGYADALKDILLLPEVVLPKGDDEGEKLLEEEDGTSLGAILIANRPNEGVF